jgi:hypothetical protein
VTRRAPVTTLTVFTAVTFAAPGAAVACPVCFGQNDSPLAWAVNVAVFVMLGFVAAVLGAFATFFVYLSRRARLVEDATAGAVAPGEERAEAGRYRSAPQEGNAQC